MAFEPVFERINFNCKKKSISEQIRAECKAEVSTDDVSSVLNVSAWAVILERDVENGAVNYGGKVIFYISYIDVEGSLKKCECGVEFKGTIKDGDIGSTSRAYLTAVVDKAECDLSGARPIAGAYITVRAEVSDCEHFSALSSGENLIVNQSEIPYIKSFGVKSAVYPVEEEFELSYPVAEVLSHRAQAVITSVQCGVGAIIVDCEV